jgi:hypothetical protein
MENFLSIKDYNQPINLPLLKWLIETLNTTMSLEHISKTIYQIREKIPTSVRLMAVSKTVSVEAMRVAYQAGIRDFGESRIQEAEIKYQELADLPDINWHLIGHLQGNKVRKAVQIFDWIHSVDSLKLAQQIDRISGELNRQPHICLQVKLRDDPQKYGWELNELMKELAILTNYHNLQICGLMVIPPVTLNPTETEELFREAGKIRQDLATTYPQFQELSMGMSRDFQEAILHGSTIIRLGSVIFGDRDHP